MTSKRLYYLLMSIIGLLFIGLLAGTYGANKLLASHSVQLTKLKAQSEALSQEQSGLTKAKQDVQKYTDLEQIAKSVVPQDKDQAEAVREIVNIASQNGVSLSAISFPASTLGTTTSGSTSTGSAPTSTSSTATKSSNSSLSQLQPVKNIAGVYSLPITVVGDPNKPVDYSKFISFLQAIEHNRRTAQVSTISITPNSQNRSLLTFTLNLNEYIKP